jgi:L-ascorbate metabolism protein UlaG (beta-lactamase superfamily)
MNPDFDPSKAHHTPTGFRNTADTPRKSSAEFFRWQRERRDLVIPPPQADLSCVPADRDYLRTNRTEFTVTWIGHATALVQLGGLNFLTDPHFSQRASPTQVIGPRRWQPPGISLGDLPHVDVVLLSHNHYDHLDADSVTRLKKQRGGSPLFVVPLGVDRWMAAAGVRRVHRMDWWERHVVGDSTVHFVPAQHWSRRTLADTNTTLWGGFVVHADGRSFYFAGDTGYGPDAREIGRRFGGFDLSLLPIGAYEPRWFMKAAHVNPDEAVQVHRDVRSRLSIAIHWGTFQLTDEPLDRPLSDLHAARVRHGLAPGEFITLRHGETIWPPRAHAAGADNAADVGAAAG